MLGLPATVLVAGTEGSLTGSDGHSKDQWKPNCAIYTYCNFADGVDNTHMEKTDQIHRCWGSYTGRQDSQLKISGVHQAGRMLG